MGVQVSASLNINGNPQIYGTDTFQNGNGNPVIANPLVHRIIVEKSALNINIAVPRANLTKVVNDSATAAANTSFIANVLSLSGLTCVYSTITHSFVFTGTIIPNIALPVTKDTYFHDDTSAGLLSIYGTFNFVYTDATSEVHTIFITDNETMFSVAQTTGTNTLLFTYQDNTIDVQDPLDNWGVAYQGVMKYEYSLDSGTTWATMVTGQALTTPFQYTLPNAYVGMMFRGTRTVIDSNNNILYESISNTLPGGVTTFSMTDATPTASVSLSDLYCNCGSIDVTDATVYQNRINYFVGVFTRDIVSGTPYYKGAELGNQNNPSYDAKWSITVPFNGAYTYRWVAIKVYNPLSTYSVNDWVYNTVDGNIYVSVSNTNTGNPLSVLVYWRQWNYVQDLQTVFTKSSNSISGTYILLDLTKTVTCNTSAPVNIRNQKSCLSSCSTIIFNDVTGSFDFNLNPYGYGNNTYSRNTYANAYFLVNQRTDGTLVYLPYTYNYLSGVSIQFDIPKDGWYRLYLYQIQLFTAKTRWQLGDIVFDTGTSLFYKSLSPNNTYPLSNTQAWASASTFIDFSTGNSFGNYQWDHLVTCNSKKTLNDIGLGISSIGCGCSCKDPLFDKYKLLEVYLRSACAAFDVYDFTTSESLIEMIPKNCAPYLGGTGGCGC